MPCGFPQLFLLYYGDSDVISGEGLRKAIIVPRHF